MRIARCADSQPQIHLGLPQSDVQGERLSGDIYAGLERIAEMFTVACWLAPVRPTKICCIGRLTNPVETT